MLYFQVQIRRAPWAPGPRFVLSCEGVLRSFHSFWLADLAPGGPGRDVFSRKFLLVHIPALRSLSGEVLCDLFLVHVECHNSVVSIRIFFRQSAETCFVNSIAPLWCWVSLWNLKDSQCALPSCERRTNQSTDPLMTVLSCIFLTETTKRRQNSPLCHSGYWSLKFCFCQCCWNFSLRLPSTGKA